ncbi:MAG: MoaD/ThiS family protein [Deltaproteobacteria bacterium]|nr:MoaD/ThiS family protein [Deltaproteobacteria bacterium]
MEALIQQLKIPLAMAQLVLVNGEQTREFDRPLAEGDTVSIFPPVAGG